MGLLCTCPAATEIQDIYLDSCPETVGQIQKIIFQRRYSSGTTENKFVIGTNNPNILATWTTVLTASDGTKAQVTPFVNDPTSTPGGPRTFGGGNATLGGVEIVVGREASTFEGVFHYVSQRTIDDLKDLQCEVLGVYFIDEHGQIIGRTDDKSSPTDFLPIPISPKTLFIGDKGFGGLENPDTNAIRFQMPPNWSDKLHIIAPATGFDPLSEISN